ARFPNGLANNSGNVGRHLMFSGLSRGHGLFRYRNRSETGAAQGKLADRSWMGDDAPFVQRSLQDAYLLKDPVNGVRKAGTVLFGFSHPNPIFTAERVAAEGGGKLAWGKALKERLRAQARDARALEFETYAESFANAGTYVDLDPKTVDRYGLPAARMTVQRHPLDHAATGLLREQALSVLRALGADSTDVTVESSEMTVLQGGTCRSGRDPKTNVLDENCRAHEVDNLYVTDGSFLPTIGGAPLTLTIAANSFRVAHGLVQRLKKGG
ncbi:MAG: GMC family oxidoreductase, partial [Deltaproteobacteria bacterium]|nr:GMC family oxidoreductase [Deltaproteobacteria bacterium]